MPSFSRPRASRRATGAHAPGRSYRAWPLLVLGCLGLWACETPAPESDAERAAAAAPYPSLSSVPAPPAAMAAEMRRRAAERLAADREGAQSADQALRPVAGTAATAEPSAWGRLVAALRPAATPPRVDPDQRADLAEVAGLVRGRAGRVRLVHAADPASDAAAAAITAELTALGVAPVRIIDQPVRVRPPVAGAEPAPAPPPAGEVQIYVD